MPDLPPGAAGGDGRPDISRLTATANETPEPSAIGVADCDREPIHIPGSIQPHALVIVADPSTLIVIGGAGDLEGRLARCG